MTTAIGDRISTLEARLARLEQLAAHLAWYYAMDQAITSDALPGELENVVGHKEPPAHIAEAVRRYSREP